jgi:hypothetical protein
MSEEKFDSEGFEKLKTAFNEFFFNNMISKTICPAKQASTAYKAIKEQSVHLSTEENQTNREFREGS